MHGQKTQCPPDSVVADTWSQLDGRKRFPQKSLFTSYRTPKIHRL